MSLTGKLFDAVYLGVLVVFSPWIAYQMIRHGKYRRGWSAKWFGLVPRSPADRTTIWLHAVSVGEVQVLKPLVERLRFRRPELNVVISTTTDTGQQLARQHFPDLTVFYCPLDWSWAIRRALRRVRPAVLVLVELELWPNLVAEARRVGSRVAVVNGRLSPRSFRGYRRLGPLFRWLSRQLDLVAVQDHQYAARFEAVGVARERIAVTGSVKFDGAKTDRRTARAVGLARLAGVAPDDLVLLAGSTQAPEEAMLVETYCVLQAEFPRLRLILVPRHPHRFDEVAALLDARGLAWQRRSELEGTSSDDPDRGSARILLVDTVGELADWWATAHIGFVGGSMGSRGGQNMIEPAAYGVATCFGPATHNFREVVRQLCEADACRVVHDLSEVIAFVRQCLEDPAWAEQLGRRAQQVVLAHRGAGERTVERLIELLPPAALGETRTQLAPVGGPLPEKSRRSA